jgi:Mn2+/Fe2+ NRAMP family transporter
LNFLLCHSFVPNQEGKMAAAEPDDETAMGTQVLVSEKSRVLSILGPGLITGASDDDPSGIATYSQVGAQFGFSISWTMLFSYPLMAAIQEISGRIGRTTGRGVAGNIRRHYPAWLVNVIVGPLLVANTINIGADLGAMAMP